MEINEEIQKAADKVIAENLPVMIEKATIQMIQKVIDDIFGRYSKMSENVKAKIEERLDVNLREFDLTDYNVIVSQAINKHLLECVENGSVKPIMNLVEDTIGFVKTKKIKLSEIHEMVIEASKEEDDSEESGEISFFVEVNKKYDWTEIHFDLDHGKSKSECGVRFLISGKKGNMFCFKTESHWSKRNEMTPSKITQLSGLEHKLFRLYSAQVEIEVDETDFENEWYRYND